MGTALDDPVGAVVASNLRQIRSQKKWTLQETAQRLAANLGGSASLSESAMSRWENDERPRRFSMTELFAICRTFDVPIARLFLPDRHQPIPTINGTYFHAVWNACFSRTDNYLPDWQLVEQTERHPPGTSIELGFSEDEDTAIEALRRASERSTEGTTSDDNAV